MHLIHVDSVHRWMEDLRYMTEVECMCILQSKPISVDEDAQSELIINPEHTVRDNLQTLLKRAFIISSELTKMFQKLEKNRWQRVHSTAVRANCHVRSLVNEYNSFTRNSPPEIQKYEKALLEKCMELTIITERCIHTEDEYFLMSMKDSIHEILTSVGESFSHMIDMALANEIQEGAVVALFKICRQDCFRCLCAHALRTLASICCVEEGISQLEKVDGILCLADILTDETNPEEMRAEAAAVVAQITSPHYTFTQHLGSFLENMEDIVTALISIECLLEMLFEKPSTSNPPEVAACERVQQKAAVTLARLSRDPVVAHTATKLNCKAVYSSRT
ncbi:Protein inscuteable-like [Acipenser ruthenus]|uniref:Protein inscuteable-like n=1 Tax=Acipenser ruthenus TaxID=7906 RepID=A0A662YW98_ACIRT|nr:Protein inscuteable-like [Acipenser ruthenus]